MDGLAWETFVKAEAGVRLRRETGVAGWIESFAHSMILLKCCTTLRDTNLGKTCVTRKFSARRAARRRAAAPN
jgi:hypothetical protein